MKVLILTQCGCDSSFHGTACNDVGAALLVLSWIVSGITSGSSDHESMKLQMGPKLTCPRNPLTFSTLLSNNGWEALSDAPSEDASGLQSSMNNLGALSDGLNFQFPGKGLQQLD